MFLYIVTTIVIGIILLSGYAKHAICDVIESVHIPVDTDYVELNIQNTEEVNADNDSLAITYTTNGTIERYLFWLYLINSGYYYVQEFTGSQHPTDIDLILMKSIAFVKNLLFMNIGGIFVFFTAINSNLQTRNNKILDISLLILYTTLYTIALHFSMLSGTFLQNIVLTHNNVDTWQSSEWSTVVLLSGFLIFWLCVQFASFYSKSRRIFKFYSIIFVFSLVMFFAISCAIMGLYNKKMHIHHYFLFSVLLQYTASYYRTNDTAIHQYIPPIVVHICNILLQAIFLGICIDGVSNYGIVSIYY